MIFLCAFCFTLNAQKQITTEDGKNIIILPDGSWKYTDQEIENNKEDLVKLVSDTDETSPFEIPIKEEYELPLRLKERYDFLNFQISQLLEVQGQQLRTASDNLKLLKEELEIAEKSEDVMEISDLQSEIELMENAVKVHKRKIEILNKAKENLSVVPSLPESESAATIDNVNKDLNVHFGVEYKTEGPVKVKQQSLQDYYFEVGQDNNDKSDELIDCEIIFNGHDKNLKKQRKETAPSFFFSYTHPKLKSYFKSKDYLDCEASIMTLGAYQYLNIFITIASKDAKKNYGSVERGTMMRITLINGEVVYLNAANTDHGTLQPYTGHTNYKVSYELNADQLKNFEKNEIDKVGIIWSTGFEEYDIYEVDQLMNQIRCLKKGKA